MSENNGNTVLATKENTQKSISHTPRKYEGGVFWLLKQLQNWKYHLSEKYFSTDPKKYSTFTAHGLQYH